MSSSSLDLTMSKLGPLALSLVLTACAGSAASSPSSTVQIAPPTTTEQTDTTVVSTTVPQTTASPTTAPTTVATTTPPPTTTAEDQVTVAIERAQTAIRNCYAAAPEPCDQAELEEAMVGSQLDVVLAGANEATLRGFHAEQLDQLKWETLDGPTLEGDDAAVATVCRYDGLIAVNGDGSILKDEEVISLQTWRLLRVDSDWKLSEVVTVDSAPAAEGNPCG